MLFQCGLWRQRPALLLLAGCVVLTGLCWVYGLHVSAVPFNRVEVGTWPISVFPPLALGIVLMFWFGLEYAVLPVIAACAGIGLAVHLPLRWLAPFGLTDAAALTILAIVYRLSGLPYQFTNTAARLGYFMSALLCTLVASSGSFFLSQLTDAQAQVTLAQWEAWWLGSLIDAAAAALILYTCSPAVERWKQRSFGVLNRAPVSSRTVFAGVLAGAVILAVIVFGVTDMMWQRLEATFHSGSAERIGRNLQVLSLLWTLMSRVTMSLILALCGGGIVLAWKWNQDLQREASRRVREVDEMERRFRTTFAEAPLGIAHVWPTGRFILANNKFCEIFGYPWEELREMNYLDIVDPKEHGVARQRAFDLVMGERRHHDFERAFVAKNGEAVWARARISIALTTDGQPDYCIVLLEDIRQRKEMEEQIRQTSKMEAVGRLAGGVAHDFNNLLTAILGFNEIARNQAGRGQSPASSLEQVRKAAERAAELTRQLLTFSRRQITQPRLLDLNVEIRETLQLLPPLLGARIEVNFQPGSELPVILADPSQISQILVNLAANAKDAMPGGGRILISTYLSKFESGQTGELTGLLPGTHVTLEFRDSGEGIANELLPKIFEPFFTTKETGRGTGLGLATVYGIVRQNQGAIEVRSEPGQGTQFVIHFPARTGPAKRIDQAVTAPVETGAGARILLVEDEQAVREFLATALERSGFHVQPAASGAAALELFAGRPFDLVLTDVVMPHMTGVEMVARMRAVQPEIPVLFMSGYSHETRVEALPGRFIPKPFTIDALIDEMRAAIAGVPASSSPRHSAG
ncbi:ATP-binding protein [Paludibaculum fermentans]|uniref:hybrid sensor histidine kinase/response regulator n=1 Tax=Paludibaculum fermentans TaxID=1473598 RepID=UPI003EBC733A